MTPLYIMFIVVSKHFVSFIAKDNEVDTKIERESGTATEAGEKRVVYFTHTYTNICDY